MSLDLKVILIVALFSTASAFIAYWYGVGVTERRHKAREQFLMDELDFAVKIRDAAPDTPILRLIAGGER